MKIVAAVLVLVDSVAGVAAGSFLSRGEGAFWLGFVVVVSGVGYVWALRDRASLPQARQDELRYMGYVPAVTSAMSEENTKLFCTLLGSWLVCLGVRLAIHYA